MKSFRAARGGSCRDRLLRQAHAKTLHGPVLITLGARGWLEAGRVAEAVRPAQGR